MTANRRDVPPDGDPDTDPGAAFRGVAGSGGRTSLLILALAALTVLGVGLLAQGQDPAPLPTPTRPASIPTIGAIQASPDLQPLATRPGGPPSRNPAASPVPLPELTTVEPGPIQLIPAGATEVRVGVDIPANGLSWYRVHDGWYLGGESGPETFISIGAWQIEHVFVYPCRWSGRVFTDDALMEVPAGLARALSTWWGQDPTLLPYNNSDLAPIATLPREVPFLGQDAVYVEVLIPSGMSFSACDGSQLILWEAADGTSRPAVSAGELNRLWVIDFTNAMIVIDVSTYVTPSDETLAAMDALIGSITITPPPRSAGPAATP